MKDIIKRLSILSLAFILVFSVPAAGQISASAEENSDSGIRIVSDGDYDYSYGENGLCISAVGSDSTVKFDYEFDENNRPVKRYMDGVLYEEYEYDSDGQLSRLTVYEDTEPTIWIYENGIPAVILNAPYKLPNGLVLALTDRVDLSWSDDGHLLSAKCLGLMDADRLSGLLSGLTTDDLNNFISENSPEADPYSGKYVYESYDYTWEYDESGRVTSYSTTLAYSPLEEFIKTGGYRSDASVTVSSYSFEYGTDKFNVTSESVKKGDPDQVIMQPYTFEYAVTCNSDGLPTAFGESSVDIYDSLNCTVEKAEIGYWGISLNNTAVNYYGELHSGLLGLIPNAVYVNKGYLYCLKVNGTDSEGRAVEYQFTPNEFGYQECIKTANGLYVLPVDRTIDIEKRFTIFLNSDEDLYIYEK